MAVFFFVFGRDVIAFQFPDGLEKRADLVPVGRIRTRRGDQEPLPSRFFEGKPTGTDLDFVRFQGSNPEIRAIAVRLATVPLKRPAQ